MADPLLSVSPAAGSPSTRTHGRLRWAWPLLPFGLSVFFLSALAYYHVQRSNLAGTSLLQRAVVGLYDGLGFVPGFMLCLLVLAWSSIWFITGRIEAPLSRIVRVLVLTVSLAVLVNLEPAGQTLAPHSGAIGAFLAPRFVSVFGFTISTVLVSLIALVALLFATDFFFYRYFDSLAAPAAGTEPAAPPRQAAPEVEPEVVAAFQSLRAPLAGRTPAPAAPTVPARSAPGRDEDEDEVEDELPEWPPDIAAEADDEVDDQDGDRDLQDEAPESDVAQAADDRDLDDRDLGGPQPIAARVPGHDEPVEEPPCADFVPPPAPGEEPLAAVRASRSEDDAAAAFEGDDGPQAAAAVPADDRDPPAAAPAADGDGTQDHEQRRAGGPTAAPAPAGDDFDIAGAIDPGLPAAPEPGVELPRPSHPPVVRQRSLFLGPGTDDALVGEAARVVVEQRRANAALLQRRLRVSYDDAIDLLDSLRRRGVIDGAERDDAGRVLVTPEEWEQQAR
jgi:hypothetical protein